MKKDSFRFTVFADFHYKKMMYDSTVEDLNVIMERAKKFGSQFVLSLGDFCNDYKGSPEIVKAFLENEYSLPVYNVHGNHELETVGNTFEYVTPLLTNQKVNFADGKGYYYFDANGYRFICLDTNYSFNEKLNIWEHNKEASWGAPIGNIKSNSLAPEQVEWFEKVVNSAIEDDKKCIICSHASLEFYSGINESEQIKEIIAKANARKKNTVILAMNGHYHTDGFVIKDDVCYFDLKAVKNGFWMECTDTHYQKGQGFLFTDYDGLTKKESKFVDYNDLSQGKNTWFFDKPLSADVEITSDGEITVHGMECDWAYGVKPNDYLYTGVRERRAKV